MKLPEPHAVVTALFQSGVLLQAEDALRSTDQVIVRLVEPVALCQLQVSIASAGGSLLLKCADLSRDCRISRISGQQLVVITVAVDTGNDSVFRHGQTKQLPIDLKMKIVVVKTILRNTGHRRARSMPLRTRERPQPPAALASLASPESFPRDSRLRNKTGEWREPAREQRALPR